MNELLSESGFQSQLTRSLERAGALVLNIHGHRMQKAGWADLQIYSVVFTGHLELKVRNRKATPLQSEIGRRLSKRGFPWFVLRPLGDFSMNLRCESDSGMQISELHSSDVDWRNDGKLVLSWLSICHEKRQEFYN